MFREIKEDKSYLPPWGVCGIHGGVVYGNISL